MIEKLKGWLPINWELAGNPVNWIIVPLMIALAGLMLAYIFASVNSPDADQGK